MTHELSHAAVCRLLGIELQEVVLFQWPGSFTRDIVGRAYVSHEDVDSTFAVFGVAVAPLVLSTVGSLGGFLLARLLLFGALQPSNPSGLTLDRYVEALSGAPLQVSLPAMAALWLGASLAFTGFPSKTDLANVGRRLDRLATIRGSSKGLDYLLRHGRAELATFHTLGLGVVGLFGVGALLSVALDDLVFLLLLGAPVLLGEVAMGEVDRLPDRSVDQYNRLRRLSRDAYDGKTLSDEELAAVVGSLNDDDDRPIRELAVHCVYHVADGQPELLDDWHNELLTGAETEPSYRLRAAVLGALGEAADRVDDTERLAATSLSAVTSDHEDLVLQALPALMSVADDEHALVRERGTDLLGTLGRWDMADAGFLVVLSKAYAANTASRPSPSNPVGGDDEPDAAHAPTDKELVSRVVPPGGEPVVSAAFDRLDHTEWHLRSAAVEALGRLGESESPTAGAVARTLVRQLDDEEWRVVDEALNRLQKVEAAEPGATTLPTERVAELLDSDHELLRLGALHWLRTVAETDVDAVVPLVDAICVRLNDPEPGFRNKAALVLATVADEQPDAVLPVREALYDTLTDENRRARAHAALVLARLAEHSPAALLPELERLLQFAADDLSNGNLALVPAHLADEYPETVADSAAVLRPHLDSSTDATRVNATLLFSRLAETQPSVVQPSVPAIKRCLDDDNPKVRENAAETFDALATVRPDLAVDAHGELLALVSADTTAIREAAAGTVVSLAGSYPLLFEAHVGTLVSMLDDERLRNEGLVAIKAVHHGRLAQSSALTSE
ncbi:hypothetical protein [Haloarchaeobius iranensis]|uniref:hypothetical protein n=1 Tax=Haloarchaeobius iranensis TaxID=996166 RepID=UPI0011146D3F|nr:hypothetical protein [Haloarchaeobius iranensis]